MKQDEAQSVLQRGIDALCRVGLKSLATGNFAWFVVMVISLSIIWKLDSSDVKEVLLSIIERLQWLGFPIAVITVYVCKKMLDWRERIYQAEMDRIARVRDEAIRSRIDMPLQSSLKIEEK